MTGGQNPASLLRKVGAGLLVGFYFTIRPVTCERFSKSRQRGWSWYAGDVAITGSDRHPARRGPGEGIRLVGLVYAGGRL